MSKIISGDKNKKEYYVLCQNIRSLFNVGSIFRTADCFSVDKIYLTGITGRPPRKEISKVALGADEYVPWEYVKQPLRLIKKLKKQGVRIVALEQVPGRSVNLNKYKPIFPSVIILGYEVDGLPKNIIDECDEIIEIPMYGQKESLNVASAFAIAANHFASYKCKLKK